MNLLEGLGAGTAKVEQSFRTLTEVLDRTRAALTRFSEGLRVPGSSATAGVAGQPAAAAAATKPGTSLLAGLGPASAGLGVFTQALGPVSAALGVFSAVAAASPGTMDRFNLAVGDVAGTLGQTLTPVMEVVTEAVRLFGDILMSILPGAGQMREALKPVSEFLVELREAIEPLVPIISDVLLVGLKALGVALQIILIPFKLLGAILEGLFGEGTPLQTSVGAKVRNLSFTSPDAFAKSVYAAAFKAGVVEQPVGEYQGPLKNVLNVLNTIKDYVKVIADWVAGFRDEVKEVTEAIVPSPRVFGGKAIPPMELPAPPPGRKSPFPPGYRIPGGIGGFQTGLWNVPTDDLPVRVHRGEMIVPAAQAEKFRQGDRAGDDNYNWLRRHLDQAKRRAIDGHASGY